MAKRGSHTKRSKKKVGRKHSKRSMHHKEMLGVKKVVRRAKRGGKRKSTRSRKRK